MIRRYVTIILGVATAFGWGGARAVEAAPPGCELVAEGLVTAEAIRGLRAKRAVPCLVHDQAQVKEHLLKLLDTEVPPEKLAAEEVLFKGIGLLQPEFNYKAGLIDLYVSQLGGYYDPRKGHFVMAGWIPLFVQKPVIVHELTHALQDHHFDLGAFLPNATGTSDTLLARSALAEGDATAVMLDDARREIGQRPLAEEQDVDLYIAQNVVGFAMMSELQSAPEGLKAMLIFPYTSGLRFAHALMRMGGYRELDRAFRAPPRSTEEILHPELYGKEMADYVTFLDDGAMTLAPGGGMVRYGDTLGEFLIAATLGTLVGDKAGAAKAAAGWGGDRATLIRSGESETLVWRTNWDTPEDAVEFKNLYQRGIERARWKGARLFMGSSPREVVFVRTLPSQEASPERGTKRPAP